VLGKGNELLVHHQLESLHQHLHISFLALQHLIINYSDLDHIVVFVLLRKDEQVIDQAIATDSFLQLELSHREALSHPLNNLCLLHLNLHQALRVDWILNKQVEVVATSSG